MSIFNFRVELDDDSLCNGCPALMWEENLNYYDCTASVKIVSHEFSQLVFRPSWCPLVPCVEVKLDPTPLTEEELADHERELKEEQEAHRSGNAALGSLLHRNKKENPCSQQ